MVILPSKLFASGNANNKYAVQQLFASGNANNKYAVNKFLSLCLAAGAFFEGVCNGN